ncbi:RPAP1-like protein [Calycina marina]|uniref:RPAP1-like protein n=1 Tax=Calycina marina TaxID=1763456 RepID=A0A9P8CGT5_9HELO|nr:RPAP1-like protein [Calycina marina]
MEFKGQRFTVDISDDEEDSVESTAQSPAGLSAFVGDIQERESTAPPSVPTPKSSATGFPEHRKRTRVSAFKQQRGAISTSTPAAPQNLSSHQPPASASLPTNPSRLTNSIDNVERKRIDEENTSRLAAMSEEEIAEERHELMEGLNPALLERLLKRANLDQDRGDTGFESMPTTSENLDAKAVEDNGDSEEATPVPKPSGRLVEAQKSVRLDDVEAPKSPIDLQPASVPFKGFNPEETIQPDVHFPRAPAAPELDPSDPSFFKNLHTKYFPSLPADPSKLAWMAPVPTHGSLADQESSYYPGQAALAAPALRFDFRGDLLPPRIARAMPTNKGLHHHGDAPESAGYTVPELSRLARSAFPAQRCIAFQCLGRILFRLGKGQFGGPESEMTKGLWQCIESGKVLQTLEEAASATGGHQGSKTYAVEAIWLWQKGGGQINKAT